MKHSILCCAVTGALASGAAFAADTQIYGVIDTGFSVRNNQYVNGNSDTTTRMVSGQYIGSRFGIKGSEDLGKATRPASSSKAASRPTTAPSVRAVASGAAKPASTFPATSAKSASAASARSSAATVRTPASATS